MSSVDGKLRRLIAVVTLQLVGSFSGAHAQPAARVHEANRALAPHDARSGILAAFQSHDVVLLGEMHWSVAQHRFIQRLLEDDRLPTAVHVIAVEFANARYQPIIDRYLSGGAVSMDSLARAWQDAIVPLAWDASVYPEFFRTIRRVNQARPRTAQLRVLALDPPIAWESVRSADDIPRAWGYRDPFWFEVLEREVLARGGKVLVIAGGLHVLRRDPVTTFAPAPLNKAGLGDALAQKYGGRAFSIYPFAGTRDVAAALRRWPVNSMADVAGTALGARSSHLLIPGSVTVFTMVDGARVPRKLEEADYPPIETLIDAVAWYGPDTSLAPIVLRPYRDSTYVAELHRRSSVVQPIFGQNLDPLIDSLARAACRRTAKRGACR